MRIYRVCFHLFLAFTVMLSPPFRRLISIEYLSKIIIINANTTAIADDSQNDTVQMLSYRYNRLLRGYGSPGPPLVMILILIKHLGNEAIVVTTKINTVVLY